MKSSNTKSSELQKEVHKDLHKVRKDIDDIQGRLTPGQFIDDAIFYPRGGNQAATFEHLKRNPVGTTLLSLGTLLLMEDEEHISFERSAKSKYGAARTAVSEKISEFKRDFTLGEKARTKARETKDNFVSKVSEIKQSFKNGDEVNSEGFAGMESSKTGRLNEARERISSTFETGKEKLTAGFDSGKEALKNMDNTTFMALGAGLGVLTGASLPVSYKEERIFHEKFGGRLNEFDHDLREALNECSNILKDLMVSDVKNANVKFF